MTIYFTNSSINLFPLSILLLLVFLFFQYRKKRRKTYLILFLFFSLYILFTLRLTLFPIRTISINGFSQSFFDPFNFNFIPFNFGECHILRYCIFGSIANIYLTIPIGFGIQFLKSLNKKDRLWLIILVGLSFEITQLVISLLVGYPYRVIDINDVIFNTFGVYLGLLFFSLFVWVFVKMSKKWSVFQRGWFEYFYELTMNSQSKKLEEHDDA